jgi:SNF2 family DNA or RNA helicase
MRLQQICGGFIRDDDGATLSAGKEKLDVLKDLVNTRLEGGEQVVIFYRFTAEGTAICDTLKTLTMKPVGCINGQISEVLRKQSRDKFQAGDSDIMLVQIATGAMGISLDSAHVNIFYSLDFSLSNFKQAKDRIMGRYQLHDVTNYYLCAKNTVDDKIIKTLKNDEDVASKISDDWRWMLN